MRFRDNDNFFKKEIPRLKRVKKFQCKRRDTLMDQRDKAKT